METENTHTQLPPAPFNGWAFYGLAWMFSVVRYAHAVIGIKDEEIARLREENRMLLNRLLKRQSTEALPEPGQEARANDNGHAPTRMQYKTPIASRNAAARAAELSGNRGRLMSDAEKRAAIKADAENGAGGDGLS